jgi:SPP1 family predicted phage head-tail adaptor
MAFDGFVQAGKPDIQVGKLRHRIQIVKPKLSQDTTGGFDLRTDNVVISCWASIEAMTGVEKFAAHEFTSNVSHKIWIRHPRSSAPTITANMQVWFNTRQFQIEAVLNPDERKKVLCLICMEVDDSQNQVTAAPAESATP